MKTPIKTIVVKEDGLIYASHLDKPVVPSKQYDKAMLAFTSSLIKVENENVFRDRWSSPDMFKIGELDAGLKCPFREGTYPAPDGLVMGVKKLYREIRPLGQEIEWKIWNDEYDKVDGIEFKKLAFVSFLPDKEEEEK